MAKNWYPMINYEKCIECGACFNKCSHGVYQKKDKLVKVINPDNCIEGCRGCQNLCPSEAIEYVGDIGNINEKSCGCCCGDC